MMANTTAIGGGIAFYFIPVLADFPELAPAPRDLVRCIYATLLLGGGPGRAALEYPDPTRPDPTTKKGRPEGRPD